MDTNALILAASAYEEAQREMDVGWARFQAAMVERHAAQEQMNRARNAMESARTALLEAAFNSKHRETGMRLQIGDL